MVFSSQNLLVEDMCVYGSLAGEGEVVAMYVNHPLSPALSRKGRGRCVHTVAQAAGLMQDSDVLVALIDPIFEIQAGKILGSRCVVTCWRYP